jgi:hypothetical protein
MSGKLFLYVGDFLDARTMTVKAAQNALENGDVVRAAHSWAAGFRAASSFTATVLAVAATTRSTS